MNGESTMKTKSSFAASAARAFRMYQLISTLASPGRSGSSQSFCAMPTPLRIAPRCNFLPLFCIVKSPRIGVFALFKPPSARR
jgi:hypothetical protein